ncbi:MAG: hypothetical protein WC556_10830 [Candidatus Methanoperedens sp.]
MDEAIKDNLNKLKSNYNGKEFMSILNKVKKDRINDDDLLRQIESISRNRFIMNVSLTLPIAAGNLMELLATMAAIILPFMVKGDIFIYASALVLMATLHPLSHYASGWLCGIRFTHYYLNGPARIEPTLRIDQISYLKASGGKRAFMHLTGVIGTLAAPLIAALIALDKGAVSAAWNLFYFFLLLIIFELLTSTKIGDLMKAKREYGYR